MARLEETEKSARILIPHSCKMNFQAIRTETKTIPDENNPEAIVDEKVTEAILFCEICGNIEALEFTE